MLAKSEVYRIVRVMVSLKHKQQHSIVCDAAVSSLVNIFPRARFTFAKVNSNASGYDQCIHNNTV